MCIRDRFQGKLDNLADITPSLPKDGAAAKIVTILKDVAKYGVLNEATVKMCIRDRQW